ncbi:hypothetical protein D039_0313B, partial [Vibrio parahaemolyticus EKP-028]
LIKNYQ